MGTAAMMEGQRFVFKNKMQEKIGSRSNIYIYIYILSQSSESSDLSDGPITVQEFMEVKSALTASEAKIQQLLKVNCHLSEELRLMQSKVR